MYYGLIKFGASQSLTIQNQKTNTVFTAESAKLAEKTLEIELSSLRFPRRPRRFDEVGYNDVFLVLRPDLRLSTPHCLYH